jgi:hypothetical protein
MNYYYNCWEIRLNPKIFSFTSLTSSAGNT